MRRARIFPLRRGQAVGYSAQQIAKPYGPTASLVIVGRHAHHHAAIGTQGVGCLTQDRSRA